MYCAGHHRRVRPCGSLGHQHWSGMMLQEGRRALWAHMLRVPGNAGCPISGIACGGSAEARSSWAAAFMRCASGSNLACGGYAIVSAQAHCRNGTRSALGPGLCMRQDPGVQASFALATMYAENKY